jgi:hypothetical protein
VRRSAWAEVLVWSGEVVLEHVHGDCTGNWRLLGGGNERRIECERCYRGYPATSENRLAAIDENYAGIYLRRLASEGAAKLAGGHS